MPPHSVKFFLLFFLINASVNSLSTELERQIERSREDVKKIKRQILQSEDKHSAHKRLSNVTDKFGPRMSGSKELEDALDYIVELMRVKDGLNVTEEEVVVPNWQPIRWQAKLKSSFREKDLEIAPLGSSVGGLLEAPVVVVRSFEELERRRNEVPGKIVVFNQPCPDYPTCVPYRSRGAAEAARFGAIASLTRSVTQYSIYSVHTGMMIYNHSVSKIPAASLTVEDVDLIQRLVDRGIEVNVSLQMETKDLGNATSRNIVAEIVGTDFPDQVIIFGGHSDSWYLTDGSMDDGGGVIIAWEALRIIRKLNLKPRRTLRVVLWTSEENGLVGGKAYYDRHQGDSDKVSLIMESDMGVFEPRGIKFTGSNTAREILTTILNSFLSDISTTEVVEGGSSSDTEWWVEKGVPGCELFARNERYFDFHHTKGDTMTVLNADHLDKATALWATIVYSVSNLDEILPRKDAQSSIHACRALHVVFLAILAWTCKR